MLDKDEIMSRRVYVGLRNGLIQQGVQNYLCSHSMQCVSDRQYVSGMPVDVCLIDDVTTIEKFSEKKIPIVLCKDFGNRMDVLRSLKSGVMACVSVWASFRHLELAIDAVCVGQSYLCPEVSAVMCQSIDHCVNPLTERESDVIDWIACGLSSKQIARKLSVSPNTVETHRRNIMQKIGAHKVAEVTRHAISLRSGL